MQLSSPKYIYVVGPSSAGKTTLCNALSQHLNIPRGQGYVTEVARDVLKAKGFTRDNVGLFEMQLAIQEAQLLRQSQVTEQLQLYDRSAIDPIVYAALFAKTSEEAEERKQTMCNRVEMEECLERYRNQEAATFVLLTPVTEWLVDDGVRTMDGHEQCTAMFREVLNELSISYHELGTEVKDLDERVRLVLSWAAISERTPSSEVEPSPAE